MFGRGETSKSTFKEPFKFGDFQEWIWCPFSEICEAYIEDLRKNYIERMLKPEILKTTTELVSTDKSISVSLGENLVSLYDLELTSAIACALTMLFNRRASSTVTSHPKILDTSSTEASHPKIHLRDGEYPRKGIIS